MGRTNLNASRADSVLSPAPASLCLVMKLHERLGRLLFTLIPSDNAAAYRACRHYVDRFNGDNDSNPATNGEYKFLLGELRNREVRTVFDIGANVGDWTEFALRI